MTTTERLKSLLQKNRDETRASGERVVAKVNELAEKYASGQQITAEITALRGVGENLREFGSGDVVIEESQVVAGKDGLVGGTAPAMSTEVAANPDAQVLGEGETHKAEAEKAEAQEDKAQARDKADAAKARDQAAKKTATKASTKSKK